MAKRIVKRDMGQVNGGGIDVFALIITAMVGAAAGGIGSILASQLFPAPSPGDGFTVRWFDDENVESRLDFGQEFDKAFKRARVLRQRFPIVEVIEIREGRIRKVTRAGVGTVEV